MGNHGKPWETTCPAQDGYFKGSTPGKNKSTLRHGSLNVPIEHHPTIRYMVYNGDYEVMFNIPKSWDSYQALFENPRDGIKNWQLFRFERFQWVMNLPELIIVKSLSNSEHFGIFHHLEKGFNPVVRAIYTKVAVI